ncbi:MAG: 30S ribosomal protein S5 [Phycisphaerales bacterium]|nr:30S ribosomal protein S5 [Phycisphaerales bacterium]
MPELLDEKQQIESTTIGVYRTSATVKGGRRFSFGALVVVGDRNGKVGFGYAKGKEVPQAVEKAQKYGQRQLHGVTRCGTTIHHEVEGTYASSKVRLIPASPGTGVVAGTVVRAVLELAGIKDCLTKCYGSTNPENILKATMDAIGSLQTPGKIAELRGVKLDRTLIEDKIEKGKAYAPAASDSEKKVRGPVNTLGSERRGRRGGPGGMSRRDRQATRESGDTPPAAPGTAPAAPTK